MRFQLTLLVGVLVASSAVGCSSSSTTAPPMQALQSGQPIQSVRADVRFGLTAQRISAAKAARGAGYVRAAAVQQTLFVSDIDSQSIRLYPANVKNPTQSGSITNGIDSPVNAAVDNHGTLYVANNGNSTVTEYPLGQTSPSVTLSGGKLVFPNGIAVDQRGKTYVTSGATAGSCYVLEFKKGASKPSAEVDGLNLPVGLAVDKNRNLYIGDALANVVWKVSAGTTTPVSLGLTGLSDPTGLAIDSLNNLWVANDQNNTLLGFHLGSTSPFVTITSGLSGPYSVAFGRGGKFFVGNSLHYPGAVAGFKKNATAPYESIDVGNPAGLAVYPEPMP